MEIKLKHRYIGIIFAEILCFFSSYSIWAGLKNQPISFTILACYGGILINSSSNINTLFLSVIPNVVCMYWLADYFQYDYNVYGIYTIIRSKNKIKWLFSKMAKLLGWIICFYVLSFVLLMILCIVTRSKVDYAIIGDLFVPTLLLDCFTIYIFLFPINLFSIRFGALLPLIVGVMFYFVLFLISIIMPFQISRWLPIMQGLYAWHSNTYLMQQIYFKMQCYSDFKISFSVLYLSLVILIEISFGIIFINKIDLLNKPKG